MHLFNFLQLRSPSAMSNRSGGYIMSHINQNQAQPEIHVIKLHKSTNGMGLSIVAAKVRILSFAYLFTIIIIIYVIILNLLF